MLAMMLWLAIAYFGISVVFSVVVGKFVTAGKGRG